MKFFEKQWEFFWKSQIIALLLQKNGVGASHFPLARNAKILFLTTPEESNKNKEKQTLSHTSPSA
jgi:hypothetical protein